jgi:hypothetical protein
MYILRVQGCENSLPMDSVQHVEVSHALLLLLLLRRAVFDVVVVVVAVVVMLVPRLSRGCNGSGRRVAKVVLHRGQAFLRVHQVLRQAL